MGRAAVVSDYTTNGARDLMAALKKSLEPEPRITDAACAVCGEQFQIDDLVTSDYGDELVHFRCGPDADEAVA